MVLTAVIRFHNLCEQLFRKLVSFSGKTQCPLYFNVCAFYSIWNEWFLSQLSFTVTEVVKHTLDLKEELTLLHQTGDNSSTAEQDAEQLLPCLLASEHTNSECFQYGKSLWALEQVPIGLFQTMNDEGNFNQWRNTTHLLGCHHTDISHPQRSTPLPTILVNRHFEMYVHQFLEEPQHRKASVWERECRRSTQAARNHQEIWASQSYETGSLAASCDMDSSQALW